MLYFILKAVISGLLVALVSEVARRAPGWGGLLASLPLMSLLAMLWLWRDTGDPDKIAGLASSTFWFFLPSMPLFVAIPVLIRMGVGFWPTMVLGIVSTILLYALMFWAAPRLGVRL